MFEFLFQSRLERKGFSSGKKRRKQRDHEIFDVLQEGSLIKMALLSLFCAAASGLVVYVADGDAFFSERPVQGVLAVVLVTMTLLIQFQVTLPETFRRNSRVFLTLLAILAQAMAFKLAAYLGTTLFGEIPEVPFLVAPYALAPMIISVLLGRNVGTFTALYGSLFTALLVPSGEAFAFALVALVCGLVAASRSHQVRRRSRLVSAGFTVAVTAIALLAILGKISPWMAGPEAAADWKLAGSQCLAVLLVSVLTVMLVGGLLPIIEGFFRITTDISWLEMADLNHPLLKQMTLEAPGTYHHSLVVANLAEAAAEQVAANPIRCRVCSYFHDIGKLKKPNYFIENIGEGENPHDELTPTMSSLIVMAHVKDGEDLALKNKLNREIVDVIKEHHGTSLISYFYHRAKQLREEVEALVAEDKARPEDIPEVKESTFRYPGPKPQSRESAIISLADSVESASRSLEKPTPQRVEQLIEDIVRSRIEDGQLDECGLTLADLAVIKKSFATTLRSMMHNRISYPRDDKDRDRDRDGREGKNGRDKEDRERDGQDASESSSADDRSTSGGERASGSKASASGKHAVSARSRQTRATA